MFERYTEKARRVIFFARYEASQAGTPQIEPVHLLLGILREDPDLMSRGSTNGREGKSIREAIGTLMAASQGENLYVGRTSALFGNKTCFGLRPRRE